MLDKLSGKFVSVTKLFEYIVIHPRSCTQHLCVFLVSGKLLYPLPLHQAPKPSPGPHKLRECIPLVVFLRNRLKYALTGDEVKRIVKQRLIKVDTKVRTDPTFPAGFMGGCLSVLSCLL